MIKIGDTLPATTLMEYVEVEGNGCSIGPNPVKVAEASAGKTIAVFAVPGAFTPTCSRRLPVNRSARPYGAVAGSGSDIRVALANGRNAMGVEKKTEFAAMLRERLA